MRTIATILALFIAGPAAAQISPPQQPARGPGGYEAPHAAVNARSFGEGATSYWVFTPGEPAPARAPVIVFMHGWGGMNPNHYAAWIEHIVRRGAIVVYPTYQEGFRSKPAGVLDNALEGIKSATGRIRRGEFGVEGDFDRFAIVGHSAGGLLALNIAAVATREGLPQPKALMSVSPGMTKGREGRTLIPTEAWEKIPRGTLLLSLAGEDDKFVGDADALRVYRRTTQIPSDDKDYVVLRSDAHGTPPLNAAHFAATTGGQLPGVPQDDAKTREERKGGPLRRRLQKRMLKKLEAQDAGDFNAQERRTVDALDYYGTWKLFDALTDAAFYGENRDVALGGGEKQRYMGAWSDGAPVKELLVSDPE